MKTTWCADRINENDIEYIRTNDISILELKTKFDKFIKNQKDIPFEFVDIVNKNFWNLI